MITWDDLREFANLAAQAQGEWAGAPIPVEHAPLVIEKRYPFQGLSGAYASDGELRETEKRDRDDFAIVNSWADEKRARYVYVVRDLESGRREAVTLPFDTHVQRFEFLVSTAIVGGQAWTVAAEERAQATLRGMISDRAWTMYYLTGGFAESSARSGVRYLFRRGRPTLATREDSRGTRILACLCLHPIGYYSGTWAGVMVPTDDVIAHLLMMRGDERKFWGKANVHNPYDAGSGI